MVASGYGVTLLPEMAVESEATGRNSIAVLRFAAPEPRRSVGLVWRRSSPRRADFEALGRLLIAIARDRGWAAAADVQQRGTRRRPVTIC